MAKKLIALLLAVLMVAGMLAACAKTAETPAPAEDSATDTADAAGDTAKTDETVSTEEPVEITIAYEANPNFPADPETFAPCQKLADELGIKITWLDWGTEADTYIEKLDLAMASGSAPDMFMIHTAVAARRYVDQELLYCIEDNWGDYPNISKYLDNEDVRNSITYAADGKLYTAARQYSSPVYFFGLLARQDIIDKIGFNYDGTIESLTDLMRAMKEETGTYTFTFRHQPNNFINMWAPTFGVQMETLGWNKEDGKYEFQGENGRLFDELTWLKQLYDEGLLDPEYALNTTEMWEEKMTTGQATMASDYLVRCEQTTNAVLAEDPDSSFELRAIALPVTKDNYKPATLAYSAVDAQYQIGINADTKYPDICMQILNYLYSDEAIIANNYGEEGVTFNYVDGKPVLSENVPNVMNNFTTPGDPLNVGEYKANRIPFFDLIIDTDLYALTYYGNLSYDGYMMYKENEWLDDVKPVIPSSYFTSEESDELIDIQVMVQEYTAAQFQDFIDGTRPLTQEEFNKFVDECMNDYDAARWCELKNAAYAAWQG